MLLDLPDDAVFYLLSMIFPAFDSLVAVRLACRRLNEVANQERMHREFVRRISPHFDLSRDLCTWKGALHFALGFRWDPDPWKHGTCVEIELDGWTMCSKRFDGIALSRRPLTVGRHAWEVQVKVQGDDELVSMLGVADATLARLGDDFQSNPGCWGVQNDAVFERGERIGNFHPIYDHQDVVRFCLDSDGGMLYVRVRGQTVATLANLPMHVPLFPAACSMVTEGFRLVQFISLRPITLETFWDT